MKILSTSPASRPSRAVVEFVSTWALGAALGAALTFATMSPAAAWTRNGSVSGARGTASVNGSGSCSGAGCTSQRTWTGPNGNTAQGSSSTNCASGVCTRDTTTTGPAGQSRTRQGQVSR